jgi:hypothetical protein
MEHLKKTWRTKAAPVRTTNRRGLKVRRRLEVKHTIDEEVFKILSLQSDSISTFLEQKTEDLQERLLACRHCFREMSWKQLDDGLCPHCLERRKLHRRIFARIAPQVGKGGQT